MTRPPPRRRTIELHLRIVEDFPDDQPPSLPAIPVDGEDITDRPGVVKAAAEWPLRKAGAK